MATLIGSLTVVLTAVMALSSTAVAWNIPGHMLSATSADQILLQEDPQTIDKVKAVLEKHPWYANQWRQAEVFNMFPLQITALCCSCRGQGGLTIFAITTSNSTVRYGITSIGPSNPSGNLQVCKSGSLSR